MCRFRISQNWRKNGKRPSIPGRKLGYRPASDKAAKVAKKAHQEHKTLREAALELQYLSAAEFDRLVRAEKMLGPVED